MARYAIYYVLVSLLFISCVQKKNLIPEDYRTWDRTVTEVLKYPIPGHEASYRKIYINGDGEKMVETVDKNGIGSYNYPEGTIIVKEIYGAANYTDNSLPQSLTCMVKSPSDPKSRGGWLWVMKTLPSGQETIIDFPFCVTCHANANEPHPYGDRNPESEFRDYVFFPYKRQADSSQATSGTRGAYEY